MGVRGLGWGSLMTCGGARAQAVVWLAHPRLGLSQPLLPTKDELVNGGIW